MLNYFRTFNKFLLPAIFLIAAQLSFIFSSQSFNSLNSFKADFASFEASSQYSVNFNFNPSKNLKTFDNFRIYHFFDFAPQNLTCVKLSSIYSSNLHIYYKLDSFTPDKLSFRGPPYFI